MYKVRLSVDQICLADHKLCHNSRDKFRVASHLQEHAQILWLGFKDGLAQN